MRMLGRTTVFVLLFLALGLAQGGIAVNAWPLVVTGLVLAAIVAIFGWIAGTFG
jgi:hypothetical protein